MTGRDYRKFLRDDGKLNVKLIPRSVYLEMLARHKSDPAVIDVVFEQVRWTWDLNDRLRRAARNGTQMTPGEAAAVVMGEMDDQEWWRTTSAFEEHLMLHYQDDPGGWVDLLDPVYDWQEAEGWRDVHHARYPPAATSAGSEGV